MARGYRNYRGRASRGKILLALFLVLVILAALSVVAMQRYIAYDENGAPFFRLPERQTESDPVPPPEAEPAPVEVLPTDPEGLEVVVQEPEAPPALRVFSLPAVPLTPEIWESAQVEMGETYGAVAVTMKAAGGTVYYASDIAPKGAKKTVQGTSDTIALITGTEDLYAIARLSCLPDAFAPLMNNDPMGLKNKNSGKMFRTEGSAWLDPAQPASRAYLCNLAREIAELGFDELLLTDTGYPTQGDLDAINYGAQPMEENLAALWSVLRETLAPYGVKLSMEIPAAVITEGQQSASGLTLRQVVRFADRVYSQVDPQQTESLTNLILQTEGERVTQDFLPALSAPNPDWNGSYLLLPRAQ